MNAIIIAVVVLVCVIVIKAYVEASCYSSNSIASKVQWTWHILCCEKEQLQPRGWNKANVVLCIMFTMLSMVLIDTGFFIAGVMQAHDTHVEGMGWILIASYVFGTVGCIGYAVGCGAHVMNRADSHVILPPAPATKCYVL